MITRAAAKPRRFPAGLSAETLETLERLAERHEKFRRMPLAKQREELIRRGALTPEGKLPVYPMDHVPLGPRE
jgi:hypothetical protein